MTNESKTVMESIDAYPQEIRQKLLNHHLRMLQVLRAGGARTKKELNPKPPRRFRRQKVTRYKRKAEVIVLAERRGVIDRSAG